MRVRRGSSWRASGKDEILAPRTRISTMQKFLLAAFLACALAACQQPTRNEPGSAAASSAWDAFVTEFIETRMASEPSWAVNLGRHEFDGRLADFSRAGLERRIALRRSTLERARAFPASSLT